MSDQMIQGLLQERAGHLRFGKADRVAEIDVELRRFKYDVASLPQVESADAQSSTEPPRGRRAQAKADSTTDSA